MSAPYAAVVNTETRSASYDKRVEIRTYKDLITLVKPTSNSGTCCACHKWDKPTWQLSTRASICEDCAKRKGDAVLGSLVRCERRARSWIKRHKDCTDQFIAHVAGVNVEWVKAERAALAKAGVS